MLVLVQCSGGTLHLPARPMIDRHDGGHLCVWPTRRVWDRSELTAKELVAWSYLVAAASRAMFSCLPQLDGGIVNTWEAGNWALHDQAEPRGRKTGRSHKSVHLHLLGRSPASADPDWAWGEAPVFPRFADVDRWLGGKVALTAGECAAIAKETVAILSKKYRLAATPSPDGATRP